MFATALPGRQENRRSITPVGGGETETKGVCYGPLWQAMEEQDADMGWGKDDPPGGPVVVRQTPVEPWHGQSTGRDQEFMQYQGDPIQRPYVFRPDELMQATRPFNPQAGAAERAALVAFQHFPTEVQSKFGNEVAVHCSCGQWWSTEDGETKDHVRAAWSRHYGETLLT